MNKIIEITEDQIRDIGKAVSALRFTADYGGRTPAANAELIRIASSLSLIEAHWVYGKTPAKEECQECMEQLRTADQIVDQTNELAFLLHKESGFLVPDGFDFSKSKHPRARRSWALACIAQEVLTDTDMESVLQECEDGV